MSSSQSHPTAQVSDSETQELQNQPMEFRQNNRLYTTQTQRQRLGIEGYGRGTPVSVHVSVVERADEYTVVSTAGFSTQLRYYGEIGVPQGVVDTLGLEVGDDVRVWIERRDSFTVEVEV